MFLELYKSCTTIICQWKINGEINVNWYPPLCNGIKINWDVAVDRRKKLIGIGLVACDHLGGVCGVMCSIVAYILDSALAEAMAARK
jgi:hypothetical protein